MVDKEEEQEQEQEEIPTEELKSKGETDHDNREDLGGDNEEVDDLVPEPSDHNIQLLLSASWLPETPQSQHEANSEIVPRYIRNGRSVSYLTGWLVDGGLIIQLTDWFSF